MIIKPQCRVQELDGDARKLILYLIREFSKPLAKHFGLEASEEKLIDLINTGILKIATDNNGFWLELYNFQLNEYVQLGRKE